MYYVYISRIVNTSSVMCGALFTTKWYPSSGPHINTGYTYHTVLRIGTLARSFAAPAARVIQPLTRTTPTHGCCAATHNAALWGDHVRVLACEDG